MKRRSAACLVAILWCGVLAGAEERPQPVLKKGDRLVLLGTSITCQKNYSRVVALYLASAWPDLEVDVGQYAISGKTTDFFCKHARAGCIDPLRPSIVTVWCYWHVDKGDELGSYDASMRQLLAIFRDAGVRTLLVGPPFVRGQNEFVKTWNGNIPRFTEKARRIAADAGCPFIDVVHAMETAEARMARLCGGEYDIVAKDGMHPASPGQMAIAVAFLRALGLNTREIARLEFDAATGKVTASPGHQVIATQPDSFTVESSRLPMLLYKDHPSRPVAEVWDVAEQMGAFEDLNRFTLVVKNLAPGRYTVRWSPAGEKVFDAAMLAKGINLAAISDRSTTAVTTRKGEMVSKRYFDRLMSPLR